MRRPGAATVTLAVWLSSIAWGATPPEAHATSPEAHATAPEAHATPAEAHATAPPDSDELHLAHHYSSLAFSAAMEGRKAETLAAVQSVVAAVPLEVLLARGDSGWSLTPQYAALVRFGLWDEAIALGAPDPRAPGLTAGYLYARGVALAARGRLEEARASLAQLRQLAAAIPADAQAGFNTLQHVLEVAVPIVAARIAATEQRNDEALALLRQAVTAQDGLAHDGLAHDGLAHDEPADWFFPARHLLGAQLLIARRAADAERVYREDLERNPKNGWSLYGLAAALREQGKAREAAQANREFEAAWRHADVRLQGSAFWFAGADTTSCECQRASISRPAAGS